MGFPEYVSRNLSTLTFYAQQHFLLVLYSIGCATAIALVLGIALHTNDLTPPGWSRRFRAGGREGMLLISSAALTIPSLALFGVLQPLLGLGVTPSLVALTIYGVYPVLRNTVAGLSSVDPAVLDAARGMGVGRFRMLWQIRLPIAWPVILAGVRVSAQLTVGVVAIAAFVLPIGLGNYGYESLDNLGSVNTKSMAIVCIVFVALVALAFDAVFVAIRRFTTPRGTRA